VRIIESCKGKKCTILFPFKYVLHKIHVRCTRRPFDMQLSVQCNHRFLILFENGWMNKCYKGSAPSYLYFGFKIFLSSISSGEYKILNDSNNYYIASCGDDNDDSNNNIIIKTMIIRVKTHSKRVVAATRI
jgi:hypothetical protein